MIKASLQFMTEIGIVYVIKETEIVYTGEICPKQSDDISQEIDKCNNYPAIFREFFKSPEIQFQLRF